MDSTTLDIDRYDKNFTYFINKSLTKLIINMPDVMFV